MEIKVSDHTLFFAFRYALGRMSTAPSIVADDLKKNWHLLNEVTKKMIKEEINEAIQKGRIGMKCDRDVWEEILKLQ